MEIEYGSALLILQTEKSCFTNQSFYDVIVIFCDFGCILLLHRLQ